MKRRSLWYRIKSFWWHVEFLLKEAIWWFRHRLDPRHRYHVVNTGLPPGYYDPDTRLICGLFNETSRFVERTRNTICWGSDSGHSEAWSAFEAAAEWWKVRGEAMRSYDEDDEDWQEAKRHMHAVIENLRCMWYP